MINTSRYDVSASAACPPRARAYLLLFVPLVLVQPDIAFQALCLVRDLLELSRLRLESLSFASAMAQRCTH